MTIAAGFAHEDGVLLCSDTQMETATIKIHAPKMGVFEAAGGMVAYALAGNVAFATSAIQKCAQALQKTNSKNALQKIEAALASEFKRVVYGHPSYPSDWTLSYQFVIAFWYPGSKAQLFASDQTTIRRIPDNVCIGIGGDLANYLIQPAYREGISQREVLQLAAYALSSVKRYVPGCGGVSKFLLLRNDGVAKVVDSFNLDLLERSAEVYGHEARRLLFSLADETITNELFDIQVARFAESVKSMRRNMQTEANHRQIVAALTAIRTSDSLASQENPELPSDDSSLPLPSRESSGAASEP